MASSTLVASTNATLSAQAATTRAPAARAAAHIVPRISISPHSTQVNRASPAVTAHAARRDARCSQGTVCRAAATDNGAMSIGAGMDVSLLGIGLMGEKTVFRLKECGFNVHAWNRSADKTAPLAEAGIDVASSAADAFKASDVVVLMLADAAAIADVIFSEECMPLLEGKWILQMGTIGPGESRDIAGRVAAAGGRYMEAPVLGSKPEAAAGKLLIMVGTEGAVDPEPLPPFPILKALACEGSTPPVHIGQVGAAAAVKLSMNQLIGSLTVAFSSSLALCQENDVDVEKFMAIVRPSALYAPTFDKKLQRMLDRDYSGPNFPTKHLLKDMRLFGKEASEAGLATGLIDGVEEIVAATVARGLAETDYSAVHEGVLQEEEEVAASKVSA